VINPKAPITSCLVTCPRRALKYLFTIYHLAQLRQRPNGWQCNSQPAPGAGDLPQFSLLARATTVLLAMSYQDFANAKHTSISEQ
jgi:hypothetical protein